MLPKRCPAVMLAVCTTPGSVDAMCAAGMAKGMPRRQPSGSDGPLAIGTSATQYAAASPGDLASGCLCHKQRMSRRHAAFSHHLGPSATARVRLRTQAGPLQSGGSAASHSPYHLRLWADSCHSPWRSSARPAQKNVAPGSASHSVPAVLRGLG